jgi:streptomycin 6-kinase
VSESGPAKISVSDVVRNKALAAGAERWLDGLPGLIAGLKRDWRIAVGPPFDGATEAYVARARTEDGKAAVLKLMIPRLGDAAQREIAVLRMASGEGPDQGIVRMFRYDSDRGAILLERLGRSLDQLGLPIGSRHEILCATAERIWRPAARSGLPTGAEQGRWLARQITATWAELGRPCSARAVEHALTCAVRRVAAHDDARAVLVHGDVHQWNVLEARDGGYKLIDPDGLLAEPEYDLGIIMREDPVELLTGDPRDRAHWLAERCSLDATAIWEWGIVERVSTGLLLTKVGLQPVGGQMLAAADHLAGLNLT